MSFFRVWENLSPSNNNLSGSTPFFGSIYIQIPNFQAFLAPKYSFLIILGRFFKKFDSRNLPFNFD